ncbi:HpcH/HpaI aldolase/citrate lyase family protein [Bacillus aquiflavi]|uniref:HpcH/HpaI aldolase/citrate lyase family protein n=1 Tax=Bacillus aquiflavi TaxID=2672567 RepID=UPI001CA8CF28|nr:HpcH/HpaI aldolase/citrate lyase family protein [Bacillus aquiflavi]UAC46969.1 HpcH/HpaI aldolase/citrate lyase family protein [Bacillus aquiflavi]
MKLFANLSDQELRRLFYIQPQPFNKQTPKNLLSYALGATLYMPATRPNIHQELLSKKHAGVSSLVICLEDAIGDLEVEEAEEKLIHELRTLYQEMQAGFFQQDDLPLLFVRVRSLQQLMKLTQQLTGELHLLTGFVFPKFSPQTGRLFLQELNQLNEQGMRLYGMPIFETKAVIQKETRMSELTELKQLLDEYYNLILNVRIGATDFCGLYGIRRNVETTVYDIGILRDCITDIINIFLRSDRPYVVSGPVWEHFISNERMLKPQLRQTPFRERYGSKGIKWRNELINRQIDGLIQEVLMDIANGITGKKVIHPTHIEIVQSLNVVTYEEYIDAKSIIEGANGQRGVFKSHFSNKMNELKPHYNWAEKILLKSQIYGVLHEQYTYIDLLKQKTYI